MAEGAGRSSAPISLGLLCLLAVLQPHFAAAKPISFLVEHAFGGGEFATAGTLTGDLDGQGFAGLELQRKRWSDADTAAFAAVARADGFYRIRLAPGDGRSHVLASLRARCLAAADFQERLALHVGSDGGVTSLEYSTPGGCPAGLALDERKLEAAAPPAVLAAVEAQPPASAPHVLLEPYVITGPGTILGEQPPQGGAQQQQQQQPGQQQAQQGEGSAGGAKKPPPPDERNFLQKNWIFLLPLGLWIFNMVGGLAAPQEQGSQPTASGRS